MMKLNLKFLNSFRFLSIDKSNNYYDILGLNKDATSLEIKSAFVNLSKKLHPDVNLNKKSEDFIKLNEAYSVLIKPLTRQVYDAKLATNQAYSEDYGTSLDDLAERIRRQQRNKDEFYSKYGINHNYYNPTNSSNSSPQFRSSLFGIFSLVIVILGFVYPFALYAARYKSGLYTPFSYTDQQTLNQFRKNTIDSKNSEKKVNQLRSNNPAYKID